jgi:hypothetical protein
MKHVDTPQTRCRAGAARGDITPPVGIYHRMWGAAAHDRATGVHRPLLATVLWLQPLAGDASLAQVLVAVDHCIIDGAEMKRIREAVAQATGLTPAQVHVALSHTHGSGWMSRSRTHFPGGDLIGPYLDRVVGTITQLARESKNASKPAAIVHGAGRCNLAAHRDYLDAERKQFVCGFNPGGVADDTVLVARITDTSGKVLATIVNYACHPTTLAWDNTAISPDYVGAMREVIEQVTAAPCCFLQGASGDLGPREGFVGDWAIADRNGRQLGYAVLSALEALPVPGSRFVYAGPVVSGTLIGTWKHEQLAPEALARQERWAIRQWTLELPYRHDLPTLEETRAAHTFWLSEEEKARAAGNAPAARDFRAMAEQMTRQITRLEAMPAGKVYPYPINLWQLGDALWVLVPGELYQTFQVTLRRRFPDRPIFVSTVTDDWQPGYLPPASSFGYGIYQDLIAAVGPGALEVLLETVTREIRKME